MPMRSRIEPAAVAAWFDRNPDRGFHCRPAPRGGEKGFAFFARGRGEVLWLRHPGYRGVSVPETDRQISAILDGWRRWGGKERHPGWRGFC
jgi:hypothetical protein